MSGGTRTHYVLCYQIGNKKYYVPFYNSQQYFIKSKIVAGVTVQVKWFVSYVNRRKLYIPLYWPSISKSLITKIGGRNYSFIRVYDNAPDFSPYIKVSFSKSTSYIYDGGSSEPIVTTNYYINLSFLQDPGYDWLCHVDIYTGTGEQQEKIYSIDYKNGVGSMQTYMTVEELYTEWLESEGMYLNRIFVGFSFNFTQHSFGFSVNPNEYYENNLYINDLEN